MKQNSSPRIPITVSLIFFYLAPVLFFSWFAVRKTNLDTAWNIVTAGLIISITSTLILAVLMRYWERAVTNAWRQPVQKPVELPKFESTAIVQTFEQSGHESEKLELEQKLKEINDSQEILKETLEAKEADIQKISQERDEIAHELESYRRFAEEQLNEKETSRIELERMMADLKGEIEKKQTHSSQLESKIRDLSYEVKTLLQLADMNSSTSQPSYSENSPGYASEEKAGGYVFQESPAKYAVDEEEETESSYSVPTDRQIHTHGEASVMLKRCIDIAQKMTGAHYFAYGTSRYGEVGGDPYALDLRRLFDSLRSETACIVLVYSQKESKLLFVNSQVKALLGWSPEKMIQDFSSLVNSGIEEWKNGLLQVVGKGEVQVDMAFTTKDGADQNVCCHLSTIPTGLFKGHVIGVMYAPAEDFLNK